VLGSAWLRIHRVTVRNAHALRRDDTIVTQKIQADSSFV